MHKLFNHSTGHNSKTVNYDNNILSLQSQADGHLGEQRLPKFGKVQFIDNCVQKRRVLFIATHSHAKLRLCQNHALDMSLPTSTDEARYKALIKFGSHIRGQLATRRQTKNISLVLYSWKKKAAYQ